MTASLWKLFLGNGQSKALEKTPDAPAWRQFMSDEDFAHEQAASQDRWAKILALAKTDNRGLERGESFRIEETKQSHLDVINAVNSALHLRRPLLVTGKPGSGKTSLAYAVAHELKLGVVLSWPITARSQLQDALYRYDAVARLQDAQLYHRNAPTPDTQTVAANSTLEKSIGDYIRLGPVGTAFLPSKLPRVLLIDEIDKCDINLPNELLNLFEEGRYTIPELERCQETTVTVRTADRDVFAEINRGRVFCHEFPFVVMTSNRERDFPPAFLRRCLRLEMPDPSQDQVALERIVEAHLKRGKDAQDWTRLQAEVTSLVEDFVKQGADKTADIATDQLLNAIYLLTREVKPDQSDRESLKKLLLKRLSEEA